MTQGLRLTGLVAGREITERLRSRTYWLLTVLSAALVVLLIVISARGTAPAPPTTVGLLGPSAQALEASLTQAGRAAGLNLHTEPVASRAAVTDALGNGSLDAVLSIEGDATVITVEDDLSPDLAAVLRAEVSQAHQSQVLNQAGVAPPVVAQALTPVRYTVETLNPQQADLAAKAVAAIGAAILLWVSIALYGGIIANGVAQEKTSRTAEVLLSVLKPRQLLVGKVSGIGACGLVQMVITLGAGLIANALTRHTKIPGTLWVLLPTILLWFLLGYALYSLAYAAAGALVSRQEEVQLVVAPFAILQVGAYLIVFTAIANPDATWVRIVSFLPPLSPVLMPARVALGHVAAWETILAATLTLAAIAATAELGARIYSTAIMHSGPRISWRNALRQRHI